MRSAQEVLAEFDTYLDEISQKKKRKKKKKKDNGVVR
jgi:hypothetical protein